MVGIFLLIFRRMSNSTDFTNLIVSYQLLTDLLENQLVLMYNFFLDLFLEKPLNDNNLSRELLQ